MAIIYDGKVPGYQPATTEPLAYPDGRIVDATQTTEGTALVFDLHNDINQLFDKLVRDWGMGKNNLPDNATNGYQLLDALVDKIQKTIKVAGAVADLNALSVTAFYTASVSTLNRPISENGTVTHNNIGSNDATQMFISTETNSVYFRRKILGTWSAWVEIQRPVEVFTIAAVGGTGATINTLYARKKNVDNVVNVSFSANINITTASTTTVEFDVDAGVFPFEAAGNPDIPCNFVFIAGENTVTNKVASQIRLRSISPTRVSLEYMDETMNANGGLDWIDDEGVNVFCNFSHIIE